ncbi:MAG: F0F1 ATP synthase subunit B [Faecalibacterium sp.]|nr:F0F1 ATP synthase subunit B [Faecalibacterium sp.]
MGNVYQALITIDPATFVVQMCNLFIQVFVLKKLLLDPVNKVLTERQAKADADIAAAKQASAEAAAIKAEYEQNMADAKAKANEIVATAQKTAAVRSEEMLNEARNTAAQIKQKAEADAAQEKKKAVNELKDEIGGMAVQIASKVVEREISEADHAALIDEFIRNVGDAS